MFAKSMSNRVGFTPDVNNPTMNGIRKWNRDHKEEDFTIPKPRGQNGGQMTELFRPSKNPKSTTSAVIIVIIIVVIVLLIGYLIMTCCGPKCDEYDYVCIDEEPFMYGGDDVCAGCGKPMTECTCDSEFYLEGGAIKKPKKAVVKKAKKIVKDAKKAKVAKAKKIVEKAKAKKANTKKTKAKKTTKRMDDEESYYTSFI